MSYQKDLVSGSAGSVSIKEEAGQLKLVVSVGAAAGGGNVAGFAQVKGSMEADIDGVMLINAALDLLAAKVPAAAAAIAVVKPFVDDQLSKL